ncbi:MAG: hypothetical protein K1X50_03675 [Candidatus Promineofilum sp.]|nr:hypothetical protein [Promineifilum sp.]MCW5863588.1 hypothetical protein [Anaerolineae bacterium]
MSSRTFWVLLAVAVVVGASIAWMDGRPTWDDTGITAGVVLLLSAAFGFVAPRRPWVWALAIGGMIPLLGIIRGGNVASLLALIVALVGGYGGALVHRAMYGTIAAK